MLFEDDYFQTMSEEELWQRYCGFLDLSVDEFMEIQQELLMDEIERVADSTLGKKIMGNQKPKSVEEFRRVVPLTTYEDYAPYLSQRQESALAEKPNMWCRSAGRQGSVKWIPWSLEYCEKLVKNGITSFILACSSKKGQVNIRPGLRFLAALPPAPYPSGSWFSFMGSRFGYRCFPPLEKAGRTDFQTRMQTGLLMALKDGVDIAMALGSILVKIGDGFSRQTRTMKFTPYMLHPVIIFRMLRARMHSRNEKRPLLPKDLWPLKAIITGGIDTAIYKDDILKYWGVSPYEFYVSTEAGLAAMQAWNGKAMTFVPDNVFLEFLPEEERFKSEDGKAYQPTTVLLGELQEGKLYEVVITHFYGMPLLRYRMRDIFKVAALRDKETGVNLPQFVFQRRVTDTIDLAGLALIDEKTIWQAITKSGIRDTEWSARKEYDENNSYLSLYIELSESEEAAKVAGKIDEQLKAIDQDYRDIDYYLQVKPVRVTVLAPGTFDSYIDEKRKAGAEPAHLKPPHMNPPEQVISRLLELSEAIKER